MPLFNYTPTQQTAKVTPTNFTAQPNQSFSRALNNLQDAAQMAGKLKGQMDQTQYDKDTIVQAEKTAALVETWEASDFNTRLNTLLPQMEQELLTPYNPEGNKYSRALYKQGLSTLSTYRQEAAREGVVDRHRDNEVDLLREMIAHENTFTQLSTAAEKADFLADFDEKFIEPYTNNDSPQAQALLLKSMGYKSELQKSLNGTSILEKDETLRAEAIDILTTNVAISGTISQDLWDDVVKKMSGVSDFTKNKAQHLSTLSMHVMSSMTVGLDQRLTSPTASYDDYLTAQKEVAAFVKVQSNIIGTSSYASLQNSLQRFKTTVDNKEIGIVNANVQNDDATLSTVEEQGKALLKRKAITQASYDLTIFTKKERLLVKKVGLDVENFITNDNYQGLSTLIKQGKSGTVSRMVGEHLDSILGDGENLTDSLDAYFKERGKYKKGIGAIHVPRSEGIDNILASARNGTIQDQEGLMAFMQTYETAVANKANQYTPKGSAGNMFSDYLVLKGLFTLGRSDILREFKESHIGTSPSQTQQDEMWKNIVQNEAKWKLDLHPLATQSLRTAFGPAIKALSKSGIEPEVVSSQIQNFVENNFIRAQATGGGRKRILIPKTEYLQDADAYAKIITAINYRKDVTKAQSGRISNNDLTASRNTILVPKDFSNPDGEWLILHGNGTKAGVLTNSQIKTLVRMGPAYEFPERLTKEDGTGYSTAN